MNVAYGPRDPFGLCLLFLFPLFLAAGCRGDNADEADDTGDGGDTDTDRGRGTDPWIPEVVDPEAVPDDVPTVEILIADAARNALEAAPFYGADQVGTFIDGDGTRYEGVDINFRGAYALWGLIEWDPEGRRNWKVKFPASGKYQGRREWNFNFEPHLRQKLAYDLMKFAGVRVPAARHVLLRVNGEPQGIYLQYADPDNKDWLYDAFGDDTGDLYKAALDLPASEGEPEKKFFADTTYLGDRDSDYRYHYNKKTNHKNPATADDFSVVRTFLEGLNTTDDDGVSAWAEAHFDVDGFLSYLAVSNFISNWDGFPQRPKNYWLYENRREERMVFIPWDMDATFQGAADDYNQMGPDASIFYSLAALDYTPLYFEEGDERPLAARLFAVPAIRERYVARYRELVDTILSADYLQNRIDALDRLVTPHLTDAVTSENWIGDVNTEQSDFEDALVDLREFVARRVDTVTAQLAAEP